MDNTSKCLEVGWGMGRGTGQVAKSKSLMLIQLIQHYSTHILIHSPTQIPAGT